jgi:hypothetical protein
VATATCCAVIRLVPTATIAPALLVIAGFLDGPEQLALWGTALAVDYRASLIGYEAIRYREGRAWIRSRRGAFTMEEAAARAGRSGGRDARPRRRSEA